MAATIWTLLSIFVIAPLGALALTGPSSAAGSGTSTLRKRGNMSEHSGVTGKIPQPRPFRASGLGQEAPNQNTASDKLRDVPRNMLIKKATRQSIGKALVSAASMALIAIGLAAPASAAVHKQPSAQGFLAAVQAAGITGAGPAKLEDGYNVCWELWNQHSPANQVAAGMQKEYPTLTANQAAQFVIAAYQNLCPLPGAYDYWAYSTS
jgi:hypothetical protein